MDGMNTNTSIRCGVALVLVLTACYTQRPLATSVPSPTTRIIARVTDTGVVAMANALGPGAIQVEGVVAAANTDAWDLHLLRVDHRGGGSVIWNRELVSFPRYTLTNPAERRLDKTKSWAAAGIITATAFILTAVFGAVGGGEIPDVPPPPPN